MSGAACAVGVAATLFFSTAEETKEVREEKAPIAIIDDNKIEEIKLLFKLINFLAFCLPQPYPIFLY